MLRRFGFLMAFALVAVTASHAQAGLLESVVSLDGVVDDLQDNSVGLVRHDVGVVGALNVGDVIAGIVRIEKNTSFNPDLQISTSLGELVVLFSAQIAAAVPYTPATGGNFFPASVRYTLIPTVTPGHTLSDLLPTYGAFAPNAIAAVLSAPVGSSPTDPTGVDFASALTELNNGGTGAWSLDAVLGFALGLNQHGFADYFETELDDNNSDGVVTAAEIIGNPLQQVGLESAGLSVLSGPFPTYLPVTSGHLDQQTITEHDVSISFGQLLRPNADQLSDDYLFGDQVTVRVNPVPEPSSMVLLALGAASACGVGLRRRRQAA